MNKTMFPIRIISFFLIAFFLLTTQGSANVIINEIHFDPINWDEEGGSLREFVELYNSGSNPVDLTGSHFSDGIEYTFPAGATLPPNEYLILARRPDYQFWRNRSFPIFGPYEGKLSNEGERLTLSLPNNAIADTLSYEGLPPWPKAPNGYGPSLERISPKLPSDDYHSWRASQKEDGTPGQPNTVTDIPPYPTIQSINLYPIRPTSNDPVKVRLYLDGPGRIESATLRWETGESTPAQQLVTYTDRWHYWKGESAPSNEQEWTEIAFDDSSWPSGPGGFGYGDTDSVNTLLNDMRGNYSTLYLRHSFQVEDPTSLGSLSFRMDHDDGFIAYLNGREIARSHAPNPYSHRSTATGNHESGQVVAFELGDATTWLQPGENTLSVVGFNVSLGNSSDFVMAPSLAYTTADTENQNTLTQTTATDSIAVYETEIPPMPNQSLVRFNVKLELTDGSSLILPHSQEPNPFHSYFVYDHDIPSLLPIVWMFPDWVSHLPETSGSYSAVVIKPENSNQIDVYDGVTITSARNGTKVKFLKGEEYRHNRTLNFSLESPREGTTAGGQSPHVEHISYGLFEDFDVLTPGCTWYRVIENGRHRQRIAVQQPNEQFLKINGRNPDGNIYKIAYNEPGGYSKKTNLDEDESDYQELFRHVNMRNRDNLEESLRKYLVIEEIMGYQVATFLTSHWDGIKNNIFLYHDTDPGGKWEMIPWDLDKPFGYTDSDPMYWEMPIDFFTSLQAPGSPELTNRNLDGPISRPFHSVDAFQQEFEKRVAQAISEDGLFSETRINGLIDEIETILLNDVDFIETYTGQSQPSRRNQITESYDTMRFFLTKRHEFLRTQLPANFLANRSVPVSEFSEGDTLSPLTLELTPINDTSLEGEWRETIPEGFLVSNIITTVGEASRNGNQLIWQFSNVVEEAQLTFDLTAPTEDIPRNITLMGDITIQGQTYPVKTTELHYRPGNIQELRPEWQIGTGQTWYISNGVLVCESMDAHDPKHAWIDIDMDSDDYTVQADVRMTNWQNGDLARSGVAVRINPDDGERGLNLLLHEDTNSVDMLNDLVTWGTEGDFPWQVGEWVTLTLSATGNLLEGTAHKKDQPENATTIVWEDPMLSQRSPGYPGLTGSTMANLITEFDNFTVEANGQIVFEDNFELQTHLKNWPLY